MTPIDSGRVGVLTFHNGPNFGGFLQAWHLVTAIRGLGYEADVVNYLHPEHHHTTTRRVAVRDLPSLKGRVYQMLKNRGFRNIEAPICRHAFTTDAGKVPWGDFDALVVGSDIVWDYANPGFGHDPAYFGMLPAMQGKPIVAYAASCGPADPDGPFPDYVGEGLRRFGAIGVRDEATARLVRNACGREDAAVVVDPTWLGPDPDAQWQAMPKNKYLLAYGGSIDDRLAAMLRDYCRSRGWQLVSALTSCRGADKRNHSLTPFQWAELFKHAEATAIVGTLHGTLFSIKYGRPFLLVNTPLVAQKIAGILRRTGQAFRLFEPGALKAEDLRILDPDQAPAPQLPATWRDESRQFLAEAIAKALVPAGA